MSDFMKMFSLEGKVALVTGASYGIGFAIASAYAQAGAKIVFNDIKQELVDKGMAAYKEKGIDAKGYASLVVLTSMSESAERMMSLIWMAGALAAASTFLRISAISSSAAMTVATESPVVERISSTAARLKGSPTATVSNLPILATGTTWSLTHCSALSRSKIVGGGVKCASETGCSARYSAMASVMSLGLTILFLTR